jgi:hypothetical protein
MKSGIMSLWPRSLPLPDFGSGAFIGNLLGGAKMKSNNQKALVLPIIAAIALCLALLGLGILQLAFGSRLMATRTIAQISARCAADSGITRALYEINNHFTIISGWDGFLPFGENMTLNNNNATYNYKVQGPFTELSEPYWLVESTGILGSQQKTVYATLGIRNLFDYGLIVTDQIKLLNNNLVDGYNTSLGPYSVTNSRQYIRIGTTSIDDKAIWLGQDTVITGDVLAGIGGVVDGSNDSVIWNPSGDATTGPWYNLPEPWYFEPIDITVPESIPNSGNIRAVDFVGPSITLGTPGILKYYRYNNIDVPNGRNLIFVGDVEIHITGYLWLKNSATLYVGDPLNPTVPASVVIYLDGNLDVGTFSAINNLSEIPAMFRLFGTGQPYQSWAINNTGEYYGVYYGPNANIDVRGGAQFYGSVSGHQFVLNSSGAALHYDHDLSNMSQYDTGFGIDRMWEK